MDQGTWYKMQISIEYLRWFQFVCVTKWRVTGSLDQEGIGLGMQRQRGYFCFRLSIRCKFIGFTSPALWYNTLSISVTATKKHIKIHLQSPHRYVCGYCITFTHHSTRTKMNNLFYIASLFLDSSALRWALKMDSYKYRLQGLVEWRSSPWGNCPDFLLSNDSTLFISPLMSSFYNSAEEDRTTTLSLRCWWGTAESSR